MDLVSVIVPVYNMENFVLSGVEPLLCQTYPDIEILLIDDGSTDKSLELCRKEAERDTRIRVFSKENGGAGSARNLGIENARGKYLYFHDIDDYIYPDALERLVSAVTENGVDLAVCGFEMYDGSKVTSTVRRADGLYRSGEELRADFYEHCFMYKEKGILGAAWGKLYKAELIEKHSVRFPDLRRHQDEVFVARYTAHINGVYFIGDALCRYYVNNNKRLWGKLTSGYYEIAKQSFGYLNETILAWNPNNMQTRNKGQSDFFYKTFLAMWEQFNPKHGYGALEKYRRIKEITQDYIKTSGGVDFGEENNRVLKAMRGKHYIMLYLRLVVYTYKHKNS